MCIVNGDREIFIFSVQLTTSRIGNLTRLILTLAKCDDHTYIQCIIIQFGSYSLSLMEGRTQHAGLIGKPAS